MSLTASNRLQCLRNPFKQLGNSLGFCEHA
jgi:hypothetical protein